MSDYLNPLIEFYEREGQMDIFDYLEDENMKCAFEEKECNEQCRYFKTCARNPRRNNEEEKNKSD